MQWQNATERIAYIAGRQLALNWKDRGRIDTSVTNLLASPQLTALSDDLMHDQFLDGIEGILCEVGAYFAAARVCTAKAQNRDQTLQCLKSYARIADMAQNKAEAHKIRRLYRDCATLESLSR